MFQSLEAKLGLGDGQSVNLPKMERQLNDLISVVPGAALRGLTKNVVGMGTPAEDAAVRS
jgi:hypothetical protein